MTSKARRMLRFLHDVQEGHLMTFDPFLPRDANLPPPDPDASLCHSWDDDGVWRIRIERGDGVPR